MDAQDVDRAYWCGNEYTDSKSHRQNQQIRQSLYQRANFSCDIRDAETPSPALATTRQLANMIDR